MSFISFSELPAIVAYSNILSILKSYAFSFLQTEQWNKTEYFNSLDAMKGPSMENESVIQGKKVTNPIITTRL